MPQSLQTTPLGSLERVLGMRKLASALATRTTANDSPQILASICVVCVVTEVRVRVFAMVSVATAVEMRVAVAVVEEGRIIVCVPCMVEFIVSVVVV